MENWRANCIKLEVQRRGLDKFMTPPARFFATYVLMLGIFLMFLPATLTILGAGADLISACLGTIVKPGASNTESDTGSLILLAEWNF